MELPVFDEFPFRFDQKINAENTLLDVIKEKLQINNNPSQYNNAINYVSLIISDWAKNLHKCENIEFLLSGSRLLNTDISDSDVDGIVVLNKQSNDNCKINELNEFFGKTNNDDECKNSYKERTPDLSLYCLLYNEDPIEQLRKNIHSRIKIIEFTAHEIKFDISFVILEEIKTKESNKLIDQNDKEIEKIIEKNIKELELLKQDNYFKNKIKEKQGEILNLASYNSNKLIKNIIVKSGNLEKYEFITKTLKLWAKNHFIYDNQFGFLNGAALNLLVLKIVLLYFDSSYLYLLEKFFQIFNEWEWEFHVKINELTQKSQSWNEKSEIISRKEQYIPEYIIRSNEEKIRLEKHSNLIMVVLTIGYPEQNCLYNVNYSTRQIIKKEFENG
uniref:polynucleotide adenylyltransferase n=1 Tax=Meloidogyne hapla TaxID=6305 RepID=A0A1I8B0Q0_MELHA